MVPGAELLPHPAGPAPAGLRLFVVVEPASTGGSLVFCYRVAGDLARLCVPAPAGARRIDGLWQHTCFEAFLMPEHGDAYLEFNFAPSGDWAAYRFAARRTGMRPLADCRPPAIETGTGRSVLEVRVRLEIPDAERPAFAGGARAGLAAVLEELDGSRSLWALAHASDEPDFHDPATFRLVLPPRIVGGDASP